ncbi:MAG: hypothetical protein AB7E47_05840 [Desulfovibrionaceae bacterium]
MSDHNANLGSVSAREMAIAAGRGQHVYRNYPVKSGLAAMPAGLVVGLTADGEVVPANVSASSAVATGDGVAKTFALELGVVVPGSVSITDDVETFSDDGFGALTGDDGGSGKVDYATGKATVTFNAAPADEAAITATVKPAIRGVLNRKVDADAASSETIVFGQVNRPELLVSNAAPSAAMLAELDRRGLWPIG